MKVGGGLVRWTWNSITPIVRWTWDSITPIGRFRFYEVCIASALAITVGFLILSATDSITLPNAQMQNIVLALNQPNIPAYLSYINYTGSSDPILGTAQSINAVAVNNPGPAPNFAISVGLKSYNQNLWMHHLNGDAAYLPV